MSGWAGLAAALLLGASTLAPAAPAPDASAPGPGDADRSAPVPPEPGMILAWSDEFEGGAIDPARWSLETDCWGGGNNERQCYTADPRNAHVAGGRLIITARRERASGPALPAQQRKAGDGDPQATKPFTSARLTTRGKAAWRYGRIEVRARLPRGQGTWPAIWMLPETDSYGPWAASGEIDILEAVNLAVRCPTCPGGREDRILGTIHYGGTWPKNTFSSTEIHYPPVLEGFHTYAIDWRKGAISWLVDGRVYATRRAGDWSTSGSPDRAAPFDKPFHLILNLAIGGGLAETRGEKGVSERGFPKQMEVEWVRVWQRPAHDDSRPAEAGQGGNN